MTADKERPCTSFAVTSAKPSEGKSLTAANIAISYAMLGKKVLLIDADMRKPTQRRLWRVEKPTGLCDFLAKISKLELDKVKDLPLWIVCTGTIPPNPSELLSSERMKHFVEESAKVYDYIIIDTPPINTVADAQIVSTYVDGVVLVVKSGDTTQDELNEAIDAVRRAGGNLCGTVLNDKQVGGACGALLTNLTAWLSGIWFDISLLGDAFGSVARALPFYHAVEACRAALNGGAVWGHLAIVLAYAVGILAVAAWCFTRQMKQR